MTLIGVVRHGITDWNVAGRAQGSSDIPLNEQGLVDAAKLAARLKEEDWDVIYSSDLKRARQTANVIAEQIGAKVIEDTRIREASGGLIEGTTKAERIEKWGENWRQMDLGIESYDSVVKRGMEFLQEIVGKHPDENVLIISHGSFIRQVLNALVEDVEEYFHLGNTSLTKLQYLGKDWMLELFNCTEHLESKDEEN
ncbi:histidine phosphatase family protein [Filobacillus milosensis]|uniref:Histidine phosphatase family protein n=1 Tax=Filobacillus milosensis TaxID=94137 RepID=A0A4Y8ISG2_9BACI|nr:histidine phosphatase family protein [Filobacillus milosensis]TFB22942.1 histidine phosphatase family protein [Filobacillus milosensis]